MRLKRARQALALAFALAWTFTPPWSLHAFALSVALSVVPSAHLYVCWTVFFVERATFLVPSVVALAEALPACLAASTVSLPASFVACPAFLVSSFAPVCANAAGAVAQNAAITNAVMI